jgi:type IV pilus assembly protein PilB
MKDINGTTHNLENNREEPVAPPLNERLGDLLVSQGIVPRPAVEEAALRATRNHKPLGEILVGMALVDERDVYRGLARQHNLAFIEQAEALEIADPTLFKSVPRRFLDRHGVIPLSKTGETLVAVTYDACTSVPELAQAFGVHRITYRLATPTDFKRIGIALELGISVALPAGSDKTGAGSREVGATLSAVSREGRLFVSIFEAIMLEAFSQRASDVHLERYGERVRPRIRVDGDLRDLTGFNLTVEQMTGIINVIKIKANMDIAERRLPQGGRFSLTTKGQEYDLRVQTQPALHGEHVVIRILAQMTEQIHIEQLGMPERISAVYRRLLDCPAGLVLVVGPTGCGKSTTLYAGLQLLAKDTTRKVISIEDPIECAIENVQQTQARPDLGFHFASAMRVFVREDPDVVLLGEIRDTETALEALRASQTGHLVLSTLHCNDSVDAVQRLLDLGMHPNSIAGELLAVFSQRLAKRICTRCKIEDTPDPKILSEIYPAGPPADFKCYRGTGCDHCNGVGTFGRISVVEYLPSTSRIRLTISRQLPLDELRTVAFEEGLVPIREHALELVRQGIIALSELPEMFTLDQLAPTGYRTSSATSH